MRAHVHERIFCLYGNESCTCMELDVLQGNEEGESEMRDARRGIIGQFDCGGG